MPDYLREAQGFSLFNNNLDGWKETPAGIDGRTDWTDETAWTKQAALDWSAAYPDNKLGRMSKSAYPWRLKKYIQEEQGVKTVNLTPCNLNGIRTDELRAFLDKDFYQKRSALEYENARRWLRENGKEWEGLTPEDLQEYKGFFNAHVDDFTKSFWSSGAIEHNDYDEASAFVQKTIKDADVIVLDICGNNFGTSLAWRLSAVTDSEGFELYVPNAYETIDDVDGLPEGLKKSLSTLLNQFYSIKAVKDTPMVKSLINALVFCLADCFVNYSADMEWIMKNKKKDAKVITVGVYNQLDGMVLESNGKEVNVGEYACKFYELINSYMRAIDKNAKNSYFADVRMNPDLFYKPLRKIDSLEAVMNDGKYEDGMGRYSLELATDIFLKDYMEYSEDQIRNISEERMDAIHQMIYKGFHEHYDASQTAMLNGVDDPQKVKDQIEDYLDGKIADMDVDSWGFLVFKLKGLREGSMIHPNANGCTQKYEAVLDAYLSDKTAYTESVQDLLLQLNSLGQKMKEAITSSDFQKIIDKLAPIKEKLLEMRAAVLTDPDVKAAMRKCVEMIRQARNEKKQAPEILPPDNNSADQPSKQDSKQTNTNSNASKKSVTTKVKLAKGKITSLKKGKKSFVVKWKKVAKADGYQISYKTGKTTKIAKAKGANKLSKKVAKLKAKKKYTVKVRAYKKVSGKMYYGKWSKAKKVTTK
jgi:hypothetical protein